MFEHPQYRTPDGYKRAGENPVKGKFYKKQTKDKPSPADLKARIAALMAKTQKPGTKSVTPAPKTHPAQKGISPEAARLIAQAIRGMLHD